VDLTGWTIFLLAFGAGLLHALDADHVMAVTAMATKKLGMKAIVRLCLNWSLGHGAVLLVAGTLILVLGLNIPHELSHYSEVGVAILLIAIGVWVLKDLYKSRAHIHFHNHDGVTRHAHWHIDEKNIKQTVLKKQDAMNINKKSEHRYDHRHDHSAVMVGVLHGMAGLAPLLVIIPIADQPPWLGIVYLFIFCIGVFLSMLIFGGALGKLVEGIQVYGVFSINIIRAMVGIASISLGVTWLA